MTNFFLLLLAQISVRILVAIVVGLVGLLFLTPAIRAFTFLAILVGGVIGAVLSNGQTALIISVVTGIFAFVGLIVNGLMDETSRRTRSRWRNREQNHWMENLPF